MYSPKCVFPTVKASVGAVLVSDPGTLHVHSGPDQAGKCQNLPCLSEWSHSFCFCVSVLLTREYYKVTNSKSTGHDRSQRCMEIMFTSLAVMVTRFPKKAEHWENHQRELLLETMWLTTFGSECENIIFQQRIALPSDSSADYFHN